MRARRGFSIIEVVIAMGLTIALLTAASLALSSASTVLRDTRTKDSATILASSISAQSRVLGCQTQVGPSQADRTRAISERCTRLARDLACPESASNPTGESSVASVLTNQMREVCERQSPSLPGDGEFLAMDPTDSSRVFKVVVASRWLRTGNPDLCPATDPSRTLERAAPSLLERTIAIVPDPVNRYPRWVDGELAWESPTGVTQGLGPYLSRTLESFMPGAPSPAVGTGSLAVYTLEQDTGAMPMVTLSSGASSSSVSRYVSTCETPAGTKATVAWFPFLTPGVDYTVTSSSTGRSSTVSVTADAVSEVVL